MSSKIALIFGYGARVGAPVAAKLASSGYSVAVVSRSATPGNTPEGYLSIKADVSDPASIPSVFETVKSTLKSAPTVVIYNAASLTPPPDNTSVLSVPVEKFVNDLQINTISPYVAAQESLKGFDPAAEKKGIFIYTGNGLNSIVAPVPVFLTLGVGKSASAHWVGLADALYAKQGYRFFYADQRNADGTVAGGAVDGPAHGEFYSQLVEGKTDDIPWQATFVKGKGYVKF